MLMSLVLSLFPTLISFFIFLDFLPVFRMIFFPRLFFLSIFSGHPFIMFVLFLSFFSSLSLFLYLILTANASKFRILADGLLINKVTQFDTGEYTCRAYQVNSIASDMQERTVLMKIERECDL